MISKKEKFDFCGWIEWDYIIIKASNKISVRDFFDKTFFYGESEYFIKYGQLVHEDSNGIDGIFILKVEKFENTDFVRLINDDDDKQIYNYFKGFNYE